MQLDACRRLAVVSSPVVSAPVVMSSSYTLTHVTEVIDVNTRNVADEVIDASRPRLLMR
jgi:hypothetical protein